MDTPTPRTLAFDEVDGCALLADVYEPPKTSMAERAAVVWIHGGGLIFGNRTMIRPTFRAKLLDAGVVVISIEHRLAPETKLEHIVQDVERAWRWVRGNGAEQLRLDRNRLAAAGGSSGAYLSLLAATRLSPAPVAVASFWGFGDITKPWEAEPSAYYRSFDPMPREKAEQYVGSVPVAGAPLDRDRDNFYLYCRQQGRWLHEVTGHEPQSEDAWFDAYCPLRLMHAHVPPVILIHGSEDMDVPCSESRDLAARMAELEVQHELLVVDGAGHGLAKLPAEQVARIEAKAADFLLARGLA